MTNKKMLWVSAMVTPLLFTACIDNGYDLSDIDTTTEIKVKDLVLPINLDPVVLSDIITLEDDGKVKLVTLNGKTFYAVEESGDFHSDPVEIAPFTATPGLMTPNNAHFANPVYHAPSARNIRRAGEKGQHITFTLTSPVNNTIDYIGTNLDKSIHSISDLNCKDFIIKFSVDLLNPELFYSMTIEDVVLNIPKGLKIKSITPAQPSGYGYNPTTGQLKVKSLGVNNAKAAITIVCTGVDMTTDQVKFDYAKHSFKFKAPFNLTAGQIDSYINSKASYVPKEVNFTLNYNLSDIEATDISGQIEYSFEGDGLHIDPIELNDLPDFLADDRTNLILHNPQIYLNITNPVGDANLSYRSGLNIKSHFENGSSNVVSLASLEVFHDNGVGPYNICLSPLEPSDIPTEFATGLRHEDFPRLGEVLSGAGLPKTIDLSLVNPEIYLQKTNHFKLGRELPGLKGKYRFLAPLALAGTPESGSVIVYTDTKDGWNDEDVDAITIEKMELSATITSTLPIVAKLNAHPIDVNGHVIEDIEVVGADIPKNAKDYPITIYITGTVHHLDGVTFEAIVRPDGSGTTLEPNQSLTLKNIRAKVSGNYTKEF
ncbi:MAG: hypothetical protein NC097_07200 [Clostridium sp.]|nr:hypothetical protein [Prevotella sp.]MCM1429563.1 hypothetical protein [Clostridium sp.]MCM1476030.1 hypothetical protein [Muribaculaceae bacterium]